MTESLLEAVVLDSAGDAHAVSLSGELLLFTRDAALALREAKLISESFAWPRPLLIRSGPHCRRAIEILLAKNGDDQGREAAGGP